MITPGTIRRGIIKGKEGGKYYVSTRHGNRYWCSVIYHGGKKGIEDGLFNKPSGIVFPYAKGDLVLFSVLDITGMTDGEEKITNELARGYIIGKINPESEIEKFFPKLYTDDVFIRSRSGAGLYINHIWNTEQPSFISNGTANGNITLIANRGHFFFGNTYLPFGLNINNESVYTPSSPYIDPPEIFDNEVLLIHDRGSYIYMTNAGGMVQKTKGLKISVNSIVGVSSTDFTGGETIDGEINIDVTDGSKSTSLKVTSTGVEIATNNLTITVGNTILTITSSGITITATNTTINGSVNIT